jgi:glucose/arabinose dehydrogenase
LSTKSSFWSVVASPAKTAGRTLLRIKDNQAVSYEAFAEGWLEERTASERPVDLLELPDGSLLISDDTANAVYRISCQS